MSEDTGSNIKNDQVLVSKSLSDGPSIKAQVTAGKRLVKENDLAGAIKKFKIAHNSDRDNPEYMSYYGMCSALKYGEIKLGLELCTKAIKMEFYRPEFYVNLSKVYVAAGNKKGAITALTKGLKYETKDEILHNMLIELGVRDRPILPFFRRSNFFNRFLGVFFRRTLAGLFRRKGPKI
ncbi:MAG: hypothetical protein V3T30_06315 [Thermodesulfobacteriota bacterium]